ncbi:helix-turn-helix domain-containing protein [Anaerocolumna jejuensis]|uniref:helix-turn-helix domain-containing protein n=1 Tax=Anaerocolumna jejuensis TaxID=259063 RepID=UPI003F7C0A5F
MSKRKRPIIEYRHYSLPLNFPIILLSGDRWRISEKKSGRLHFHNCLEIGICHSDGGIMEFEDISLPFQEGDITCVPKHLPHTTYSSPGTASLWTYIFVDPEELFRNMVGSQSNNFDKPMSDIRSYHLIMSREDYPKVYYLASAIAEELKSQKTCYQNSVKGLMLSLYVELLRIHTSENSKNNVEISMNQDVENILVISDALEHIHKNYMEPINIGDLADISHLSVSHFRRIFHEIMGTAPLNYLNSTRIDAACWLLRSTEDSILTVSEKVGFHSISSFDRCFVKLMKTSPNIWRKQAVLSDTNSPKAAILEFTGWV